MTTRKLVPIEYRPEPWALSPIPDYVVASACIIAAAALVAFGVFWSVIQ